MLRSVGFFYDFVDSGKKLAVELCMQLKMAVRGRPIVLRRVATRFAVIAWFGYSSQQCSVVANEVTSMSTDLTFFTNEPGSTLLARFKKTLKDVQFFDILVG